MKEIFKIRKMTETTETTEMNMSEKVHSTPKGKRGYSRSENRRAERNWDKEQD